MGIPGMPCRHHAIEHIDAAADRFENVLWPAHAHEITRLPRGHVRHQAVEHPGTLLDGLADRQTADRKSFEADVLERRQRLEAKIVVYAALHDTEQGPGRLALVVLPEAALGPAHRQLHRRTNVGFRGRI